MNMAKRKKVTKKKIIALIEKKKKHNGHPYKETCKCAMCKRITKRNGGSGGETLHEKPVVETPVVETPVVETPVVETPVVETPVVETFNHGSAMTKEDIIKEYLETLPNNVIMFDMNDENSGLILQKIGILKKRIPFTNYRDFVNNFLNLSLVSYLKALPNE